MPFPILGGALKETEVLLCSGHGSFLICDANVNDTVCSLYVDGPDVGGFHNTKAATFDHCGTRHADVRVLCSNDYITTTEQRSVARKAVARCNAHERNKT